MVRDQNRYLKYPLYYRWVSGEVGEMLYTFTVKHTGSSQLHVLRMPSERQPGTLKWSSEQKIPSINIIVKTCPHAKPRL